MSIEFGPQTGMPTDYDGPTDQGTHFIVSREEARRLEPIHAGEELPEPVVADQQNTNKLVQFICRFLKP